MSRSMQACPGDGEWVIERPAEPHHCRLPLTEGAEEGDRWRCHTCGALWRVEELPRRVQRLLLTPYEWWSSKDSEVYGPDDAIWRRLSSGRWWRLVQWFRRR